MGLDKEMMQGKKGSSLQLLKSLSYVLLCFPLDKV